LHVFPSLEIGGQQMRFATIANHLGSTIAHRLISLDGQEQALRLLDNDVTFEMLSGLRPARGLRRLLTISKILRSTRADVLVTYNWGAIEWAIVNRLSGRLPHIHLEDGFGPDEADGQKAQRVIARSIAVRGAQVLVPSKKLERIAIKEWHLRSDRVKYVPNGIKADRFKNMNSSDTPYFSRVEGECIIGSFSPLRPEKNISRLLTVFAGLPKLSCPTRLVLCGEGPDRDHLMALAQKLGLGERVVFAGHVKAPELVMGCFDLLALTSDTEQMPYAVLEGMAAGLPIFATDVGDIAIMVDPENGPFIAPRERPDLLGHALHRLCSDPPLRARLARRNRDRVNEVFTISRMADGFEQALRAAMA